MIGDQRYTEALGTYIREDVGSVGEHCCLYCRGVSRGLRTTSENADMSNDSPVESRAAVDPKVSLARIVRQGLVGT